MKLNSRSRILFSVIATVFAMEAPYTAASSTFEGVIGFTTKTKDMNGENQLYLKDLATRMETSMTLKNAKSPMKTIAILDLKKNPNLIYFLNEKLKTYFEIDMAAMKAKGEKLAEEEQYTLKKINKERVQGYLCEHILLTGKKHQLELWTSKDILNAADYERVQGTDAQHYSVLQILKQNGVDGFFARTINRDASGKEMARTEVTTVTRKGLTGDLFALPSGYTKASFPFPAMGNAAGGAIQNKGAQDAQAKIQDALKGKLKLPF